MNIPKRVTAVYHDGRLSHFFYNEGNKRPLDMRNLKSTSNPQLSRQLEKVEIAQLFIGGNDDFFNILFKYILPIGIFIGVIALIFILTRGQTQAPVV